MRVLSLIWINRIADALGVESSDLVALPDQQYLPVAAMLHEDGTHAPTKEERIMVPNVGGDDGRASDCGGNGRISTRG